MKKKKIIIIINKKVGFNDWHFDQNRSEAVQKRFHRNYARSRRRFENVQEGNEQVKDMEWNFAQTRNSRLTPAYSESASRSTIWPKTHVADARAKTTERQTLTHKRQTLAPQLTPYSCRTDAVRSQRSWGALCPDPWGDTTGTLRPQGFGKTSTRAKHIVKAEFHISSVRGLVVFLY